MSRADSSRSFGQETRGTDHRGEGGRAERLGGKDVLSMMVERDQDRAEDSEGAEKGEAAGAKKKASVGGKAKATAKSGAKAKAKKRKTTKKTPLKAASFKKRPSAASDTKLPSGYALPWKTQRILCECRWQAVPFYQRSEPLLRKDYLLKARTWQHRHAS